MTTMTRPRVVAITGGARGIGFHTAEELIRRGHRVAIGDIDEIQLKSAAKDLRVEVAVRLDVTDPKSISAFLDATEDALGPIDVLINNAGVMPTGHAHEEEDEVTRRQVEINVLGVIFGTKLALQRMLPRRQGHIINTASLAGELPVPGLAPYPKPPCGPAASPRPSAHSQHADAPPGAGPGSGNHGRGGGSLS